MFQVTMFYCSRVATEAIAQETRNPTDCSDADARQFVNTTIGEVLPQQTNDPPAIYQCLQLGRCAQVFEKVATFARVPEAVYSLEKGIFVASALAVRVISIGLHDFESLVNVIVY